MASITEKAATRAAAESSAVSPPKAPPATWAARALFAVALVFLLQLARPLLLPMVIALAFTFVLSTAVRHLRRVGIPEFLGAGLVVAAGLCTVALAVSMLASPATEWWDRVPETVSKLMESADRVRHAVLAKTPGPPRKARQAAAQSSDALTERIANEGVTFTRLVVGQMFSFALEAAATVILLYFLLASEHWLLSRTVEAVPRWRTRALVVGGVRQAQREIGLYLGTMTLINLGIGAATAFAMSALGLPNPLLWGAMAAVLNYIPYLGPALMTGCLLLAGSMSFGAEVGMLAPPAAFLALHAIESNLVSPWVIGRRLRLAPLSVFLSVMFWGWLWGIAGAFVAVPILLGLRTICKRSKRFKLACIYMEGDSSPPTLRALLRAKRRQQPAQIGP